MEIWWKNIRYIRLQKEYFLTKTTKHLMMNNYVGNSVLVLQTQKKFRIKKSLTCR